MDVRFVIPDDIAERLLTRWPDLAHRALECLAAGSYRNQDLTSAEVQRMLGFETRWDTDGFLKKEGAYLHYTEEDLQRDIETMRRLFGE
jgi:uncharacterized protein UPF0175